MDIQKIQKWQRILEGQLQELTDILERRLVFQETKKIVENNPAINQDNIFYDYLRMNYVYAQIIQLYRMLDSDPRVDSLVNLLADLEKNPEIFERKWRDELNKLHNVSGIAPELIEALEEKTLNAQTVSQDKNNLLSKFAPFKTYRDKQVAHKQAKAKKANLTFQELDQFIDHLHERVLVYAGLLHGSGYPASGLLPIIQYDWQEIFRTPWIP